VGCTFHSSRTKGEVFAKMAGIGRPAAEKLAVETGVNSTPPERPDQLEQKPKLRQQKNCGKNQVEVVKRLIVFVIALEKSLCIRQAPGEQNLEVNKHQHAKCQADRQMNRFQPPGCQGDLPLIEILVSQTGQCEKKRATQDNRPTRRNQGQGIERNDHLFPEAGSGCNQQNQNNQPKVPVAEKSIQGKHGQNLKQGRRYGWAWTKGTGVGKSFFSSRFFPEE